MAFFRIFLTVILLTTGVFAQTGRGYNLPPHYREVSLAEIRDNPHRFSGQRVTFTAEIFSLAADSRSLDLYDGASKAMINVSLVNIKKSERRALVQTPVHRISVSGKLNVDRGQVVLEAERVEARLT